MPINGFVVAVHISLIKSVTKLDDTIRFQFHVPGKAKLSVPANAIAEEQPNTVWIKVSGFFFFFFHVSYWCVVQEAVYHLQNSSVLANIDRSIKEMRKRVAAQEKRKTDLAGLQEQVAKKRKRRKLHSFCSLNKDALVLSRERAPQLSSLYARPSLAGKRILGTLEAHKNGFRYTTAKVGFWCGIRLEF